MDSDDRFGDMSLRKGHRCHMFAWVNRKMHLVPGRKSNISFKRQTNGTWHSASTPSTAKHEKNEMSFHLQQRYLETKPSQKQKAQRETEQKQINHPVIPV